MDDFNYDCMVKKRIASGSRHMKRGSRSKYCGLPSDHLTPAQMQKKNGVVVTMSMTKPMDWATFKQISPDLKEEYMKMLVGRFNCSQKSIAKDVLGVNPLTLRKHLHQFGCAPDMFEHGRRMTAANQQALQEWLQGDDGNTEDSAVAVAEDAPESETESVKPLAILTPVIPADSQSDKPSLMRIGHTTLEFRGRLNANQVLNTMRALITDREVRLQILIDDLTEKNDNA